MNLELLTHRRCLGVQGNVQTPKMPKNASVLKTTDGVYMPGCHGIFSPGYI